MIFALLLGALVLVWRFKRTRDDRNRERFNNQWSEHLTASSEGPLPELPDHRLPWFVELWNRSCRQADDETRSHLRSVARELTLPDRLEPWLESNEMYRTLVALAFFGYLGDESHWSLVSRFVDADRPPVTVLTALRALGEMNPSRMVDRLVDQVKQRQDLPAVQVHRIMARVPAAPATEVLLTELDRADLEERLRLIPYLVDVDGSAARDWCLDRLDPETHPEELARILDVLETVGQTEDGRVVAELAGHPEWFVRVHVAITIGELGYEEGKDTLVRLLRDGNWWVRLRAARALKQLPLMTPADLKDILDDMTDFYARDMLRQEFNSQLRRENITL